VFLVAAGVLALLFARGERRAFHLPGGDGTVILVAGLWVMFLVFYRQLDKPDGRRGGDITTTVGVEWGIFVAFLLGALLAYAGARIRSTHTPEPPADDAPTEPAAPSSPRAPGPASPGESPTEAAPPRAAPPSPPADEAPTAVSPRPPRRTGDDPLDGQLSFDDPAEYRPPRRGG
jgi:hypothetical protein